MRVNTEAEVLVQMPLELKLRATEMAKSMNVSTNEVFRQAMRLFLKVNENDQR